MTTKGDVVVVRWEVVPKLEDIPSLFLSSSCLSSITCSLHITYSRMFLVVLHFPKLIIAHKLFLYFVQILVWECGMKSSSRGWWHTFWISLLTTEQGITILWRGFEFEELLTLTSLQVLRAFHSEVRLWGTLTCEDRSTQLSHRLYRTVFFTERSTLTNLRL